MAGPTTCTFGNTVFSRGFDFTFAPGGEPSVCMLNTVPHTTGLPNVGTLRFQTAGEQPFEFRDCLLEDPRLTVGDGGQHWILPVKDRRWKWQFGFIHGSYNVAKPDGSRLREKTPQELALLLLAEMDETIYDVSRLPNDTRPEVHWEGALPAAELDSLCDSLGCLVSLNPFTDKVEIWPAGEGAALPAGPQRGASYAPVYPAQPEDIRVEAHYTRFQATFKCEAVGLDTDDRWKAIDDLSYKPAIGWHHSFPLAEFPEITGTYTLNGRTLNKNDLANATVFRCYRINGLAGGGWAVPLLAGTPLEPQSLKDFRLSNELADEELAPDGELDPDDGGLRTLPAVALARYYREHKALPANPIRYTEGFQFNAQNGIMTFNQPLFIGTSGEVTPATVRYECAFHAGANGQFHRHAVTGATGSAITTPARLVKRDDIHRRVIYRYNNDAIASTEDTLTDTDTRLNYWKQAALDEYGLQSGGTINYQKLMAISPDGLTQQVTWSGGGGRPASTTVSQAQRHNRFIAPLDEYRDRLAAKRAELMAQTLALHAALRFVSGGAV